MAEYKAPWSFEDFFKPGVITIVGIIAIIGTFELGKWWGHGDVLDGEILRATNEVQYQLVTVRDTAPDNEMMQAATTICQQEQTSSIDDCMKGFINGYGQVWVVNLVDGTRTLLSVEDRPVAPMGGDTQ